MFTTFYKSTGCVGNSPNHNGLNDLTFILGTGEAQSYGIQQIVRCFKISPLLFGVTELNFSVTIADSSFREILKKISDYQ